MNKIIEPGAFDFGVPMASLVDIHRRGVDHNWMVKRAASAGVFEGTDLKPQKDHSIVHLIAMGDAEYYGMNRNGDIFYKQGRVLDIPEPFDGVTRHVQIHCGNVDRHPTFVKYAHVYRNHKNKDPKKSQGDVIKSAHNGKMSRVELLVELPNHKWGTELHKLASGEPVEFSMACRVPYDVCTYCGHKAAKKEQYCPHAKDFMTQILKSGHQVGVANDFMTYFDISKVYVNADRIAYGLMKAAGMAGGEIVPAAYLADDYALFPPEGEATDLAGLSENETKLATLKKLSEIEKEIEARANPSDNSHLALPDDLPEEAMAELQSLASADKANLFGAMSDVQISLSLRDFLKLVMGNKFSTVSEHVDEAETCLPGMFGRMLDGSLNQLLGDDVEMGGGLLPKRIRDIVSGLVPTHSLAEKPARGRVSIVIVRGKRPESAQLVKPAGYVADTEANSVAMRLAEAYGRYKLAFLQRNGGANNRSLTGLAVLQHYWS